ncbi:papain family cysteine protease (macronuclear) [Tetrahymena thermophila SB210]|uniref:Papain family cysteine protease n=1 Tax=Tetrahymena thermophila (strain SB210) TaxID=312017 RepID=I7LV14_TETTS|nr:papain family cysteine protease [Tetrahymena thermophila SB210]EAR96460.2 papain family cysteine protease [Tetrahymena thermophila SB210]|eukprot:XP_001016705.2 papain family cysteine protease [Tetrahymena thermophila SB210]
MRQTILIAVLVLCAASVIARNVTFEQEVAHGRHNPTEAELLKIFASFGFHPNPLSDRFRLFKKRLTNIIKHNLNPHKKFTQKINKFTFKTQEEIRSLNAAQNCSATARENMSVKKTYNLKDLPQYVDWRTKGVVTPVKDQGECGSCWTFSTTGALESHWALHTGNAPLLLSEQQLIDCAGAFNNFGCDGGLPSQAYEYISYAGGLETEGDYPYEGTDNSCEFNRAQVAAKVVSSYNITFQDENELIYHLATVGPVSIAYECTDDFMDYEGGIYSNPSCSKSPEDVNHAVLAVGYNLTGNYYIVKNSWGEDWGINGYFYIELGSNMCGLADCASYPIVHTHHEQ